MSRKNDRQIRKAKGKGVSGGKVKTIGLIVDTQRYLNGLNPFKQLKGGNRTKEKGKGVHKVRGEAWRRTVLKGVHFYTPISTNGADISNQQGL